jgi:hypothetical protein
MSTSAKRRDLCLSRSNVLPKGSLAQYCLKEKNFPLALSSSQQLEGEENSYWLQYQRLVPHVGQGIDYLYEDITYREAISQPCLGMVVGKLRLWLGVKGEVTFQSRVSRTLQVTPLSLAKTKYLSAIKQRLPVLISKMPIPRFQPLQIYGDLMQVPPIKAQA